MVDYISDRISDYLADKGRVLFTPYLEGEDTLVPNAKSEFDATVVEAEIIAFDAEAAAIYRDAGLSRVEHGITRTSRMTCCRTVGGTSTSIRHA